MKLDSNRLRERLQPLFEENFGKFGELGAALSVWQAGEPVLDLHAGFRDARREKAWDAETLVLVWSATKGIGSASLLHLLQENKIDPFTRPVAQFWPEFGQNGKNEISLATLLSHSAGLCALDESVDVRDYAAVIRALEKQKPLWPPRSAHGYHARTFGFLLDELVRRISGLSLAQYWRQALADPLRLDFWIGLPDELNNRVATIYAARAGKPPEPAEFYRDLAKPGSLAARSFKSPAGLHSVSAMNQPAVRALPIVSFGGIGSAYAVAKFYALLANDGVMDGQRYFSDRTIRWMKETVASGPDRVFGLCTAFSCGFMRDPNNAPRRIFGPSDSAFGHPGAGGSHALADPENKISFSYVMNQMEQSVLPTQKSLRLLEAIYR